MFECLQKLVTRRDGEMKRIVYVSYSVLAVVIIDCIVSLFSG